MLRARGQRLRLQQCAAHLGQLQRCSISSTRHASSTAESALRAAAAQQQQQRRADAKRREASKRWRAGGRLLDEFRRLERDKAATREETRLAVMVALKRNALQRPAHVAAAARALAARGDAAGAAWLVGSSGGRRIGDQQRGLRRGFKGLR